MGGVGIQYGKNPVLPMDSTFRAGSSPRSAQGIGRCRGVGEFTVQLGCGGKIPMRSAEVGAATRECCPFM
ncbi:hypothetical protein CHISP_0304 [Chitinispirillum alkaliphilum]|nr:hypothetical protein CHISP_0304 [Chitinispirillum alkaliphilum]